MTTNETELTSTKYVVKVTITTKGARVVLGGLIVSVPAF
jgi:hypothetical protein